MECKKCGTWNPDDKIRCWRCNAELPKPPEPRKSKKINSQTWMWIMVAAFIILTMTGIWFRGPGMRLGLPWM